MATFIAATLGILLPVLVLVLVFHLRRWLDRREQRRAFWGWVDRYEAENRPALVRWWKRRHPHG